MDLVEYHLKLVINLWCGAVPSQYTVDSQLRDIWSEQVPSLDYDVYGVPSFMKEMYHDPLFSSCPAAHNITPGELITGGGLQTFSAIYIELSPCASNPMFAKAMLPFATAASLDSNSRMASTKEPPGKRSSDKKRARGRT